MSVSKQCVISNGCVPDARTDLGFVIEIGDDYILSNNVVLSCRNGSVSIGQPVGNGAQTIIHVVNSRIVEMDPDDMIGSRSYLAGGGNRDTGRLDVPISQQGLKQETRVRLGCDSWLGAKVSLLPEADIGTGSIVAGRAVVTTDIVEAGIAMGASANTTRIRGAEQQASG